MSKNTVQNEKDWHNKYYADGKYPEDTIRGPLLKFYIATEYPNKIFKNMQRVSNLKVLDIGCGRGLEKAKGFISRNCSYTGIDISESCINANKKDASDQNLNAIYLVEDANEISSLKNNKYDLIIITGTLHHLELKKALPTIRSLTKEETGIVLMFEPMGTNFFINIFRLLTPNLRSPDEHPLTFKDINLIRKYFSHTNYELHTITSLLTFPFGFIKFKPIKKIGIILSLLFGKFDRYVLGKLPIINLLSWSVIIRAKP